MNCAVETELTVCQRRFVSSWAIYLREIVLYYMPIMKSNHLSQVVRKPVYAICGADKPAHPRSLISAVVVHDMDSVIPLLVVAEISRLYLVSVAKQAGLRLNGSQTPKTGFLVTRFISELRYKFGSVWFRYKWAATWQNQQSGCAPSEDSDQPGHPPSLISLRCALNG